MRIRLILGAAAALTMLSGCISFGAEPPDQLLTLTSAASVPAGTASEGDLGAALAVQVPSVPQRLNVTRVPVMTGDTSLAYLQDAFWVQKPAQLFQNVLAETIRAKGNRMVVSGGELEYAATTQLMGELAVMDYDAPSRSVTVRYNAVLAQPDGRLLMRRFEASVPDVMAEPLQVGRALNLAANQVAGEVADWVD